jgi:hypothetical protein
MNPRCRLQRGLKKIFEDLKNNGLVQQITGPALHVMTVFHYAFPLT